MDKGNDRMAGVEYDRGDLLQLSRYLYNEHGPVNFMISGGAAGSESRYWPLYGFLKDFIGQGPIIIMHDNDLTLEKMVENIYYEEDRDTPLWITHTENPEYEPFYGMTDAQIRLALKNIAEKLGYTVAPSFDKVVSAHLEIIRWDEELEKSLSGLYYLANCDDMEVFYNYVMALPCGKERARIIWANIGANQNDTNGQFDLFREVINKLAIQAEFSGWTGSTFSHWNCQQAVDQDATMLFSINLMYRDTLLTYITEELKAINPRKEYILIVDDVALTDDSFKEYLKDVQNCRLGIVSPDVVKMFNGTKEEFGVFGGKINEFIFFKHGTGETASYLSEIMGQYERTKEETSESTTRGSGEFFRRTINTGISKQTEFINRVLPENIIGLNDGQAIIYDVPFNRIIYYN